jgi:cytochrome b involved in lipid metabolism
MKKILVYIVLVAVIIGGGYYFLNKSGSYSNNTKAPANVNNIAVGEPNPSVPTKSYTLADVSTHKDASSCWTAINGNVYDVTSWIDQHPGGRQAILSICGTDGSSAFDGQHGGQKRPESELANFIIGKLTK